MTLTDEYDPKGHDRGPMTSGRRIHDDFRSHVDPLNGPWPAGPAVMPVIEQREAEAAAVSRRRHKRKPSYGTCSICTGRHAATA